MGTSSDNFSILVAVTDSVSFTNRTHNNLSYYIAQNAANDSPSPGGEVPVLLGKHSTFNSQLSTDYHLPNQRGRNVVRAGK